MALNPKANHDHAMDELIAGLQTKSDKIRALSKAGYSRSQIADFLGIRYPHVRNVLVNDDRVARGKERASSRDARRSPSVARASDAKPDPTTARVETDGRVAIPSEFLAALGLHKGDAVILSLDEDAIQLMSLPASVRRVQTMVRQFIPEGVSLVDELLAERRLEAKREDDNG
jgi:bifunctional DNA-binding transcriptional regulator/antitoxin component of YhaV-PrlF toxin-antitoxin module